VDSSGQGDKVVKSGYEYQDPEDRSGTGYRSLCSLESQLSHRQFRPYGFDTIPMTLMPLVQLRARVFDAYNLMREKSTSTLSARSGRYGFDSLARSPIVGISIRAVAVPRPGIVAPIVWITIRTVAVTVRWVTVPRVAIRRITIRTSSVIVVPNAYT
jgi:hypothetical protein